jgi:hypothetical protein
MSCRKHWNLCCGHLGGGGMKRFQPWRNHGDRVPVIPRQFMLMKIPIPWCIWVNSVSVIKSTTYHKWDMNHRTSI